jgi:NAD-reducing hydrogenase small subunit
MAKVKVASVWLEGCSGCHMSFLDIDAAIIDLANAVEFTRTPITDIKEFPEVDVGIVEGSVGNTEEEEVLKELRAHCTILMAWGDCACFGGVCAMRSTLDKEDVLRRAYIESESTFEGKIPRPPGVPALLDQVKPVNNIVKVDCYIPGCPPEPKAILYGLNELLAGRIPVLPPDMMRFD